MGKDKVGHHDLTSGLETTLHSHPGGGNGAVIKAGTITTDGNGVASVVFGTPFSDINYAISFACEAVDTVIATWSNKTAGGFNIKTENDKGVAVGNAPVNWIAMPYSNP